MQPEHVVIRPYREDDLPAIEALFDEFQGSLVDLDPLRRLRRAPGYGAAGVTAQRLRVVADRGRWLVAEVDGTVVGFVVGSVHETTPEDELEVVSAKRGRVAELYVQPHYRRRGIARNLMAEIETWCRGQGCQMVQVEVFAPNEQARSFYEQLGYLTRYIDHLKQL